MNLQGLYGWHSLNFTWLSGRHGSTSRGQAMRSPPSAQLAGPCSWVPLTLSSNLAMGHFPEKEVCSWDKPGQTSYNLRFFEEIFAIFDCRMVIKNKEGIPLRQ